MCLGWYPASYFIKDRTGSKWNDQSQQMYGRQGSYFSHIDVRKQQALSTLENLTLHIYKCS